MIKNNNDIYLSKIDKIDEMLFDEKIFDDYIKNIENNELQLPSKLIPNIKNKILEENYNTKNNIKEKNNYFSYLKVASFVLIVMVTWNMMQNSTFINKKEDIRLEPDGNRISVVYGKMSQYTSNFSNLLLNSYNFKGGEK